MANKSKIWCEKCKKWCYYIGDSTNGGQLYACPVCGTIYTPTIRNTWKGNSKEG